MATVESIVLQDKLAIDDFVDQGKRKLICIFHLRKVYHHGVVLESLANAFNTHPPSDFVES
jgi:hypothetical protein